MFKVGDRVYCTANRVTGTVVVVQDFEITYPITVQYDNEYGEEIYTEDGMMYSKQDGSAADSDHLFIRLLTPLEQVLE